VALFENRCSREGAAVSISGSVRAPRAAQPSELPAQPPFPSASAPLLGRRRHCLLRCCRAHRQRCLPRPRVRRCMSRAEMSEERTVLAELVSGNGDGGDEGSCLGSMTAHGFEVGICVWGRQPMVQLNWSSNWSSAAAAGAGAGAGAGAAAAAAAAVARAAMLPLAATCACNAAGARVRREQLSRPSKRVVPRRCRRYGRQRQRLARPLRPPAAPPPPRLSLEACIDCVYGRRYSVQYCNGICY
jgi:hypothetical protein